MHVHNVTMSTNMACPIWHFNMAQSNPFDYIKSKNYYTHFPIACFRTVARPHFNAPCLPNVPIH